MAKWRPPVLISKDDTPPVAIPDHLLIAAPPPEVPPLATTARMMPAIDEPQTQHVESVEVETHAVLQQCLKQVSTAVKNCTKYK